MFAKSFIANDGNSRLTSARTAQTAPYDRYTCHLCGSALQYHPGYDTERPWFEHTRDSLTDNGQHHCPYVKPDTREVRLIRRLQRMLLDVMPRVGKADWHCSGCNTVYYGERYCLICRTGDHSTETHRLPEVAVCAEKETRTCLSCGCLLLLHPPSAGFEHDQGSVPVGVLMRCTHLDPEVKVQALRRKLCRIVDELNTPVIVLSWYCVWCGSHYQGKKHRVTCDTGL